MIKSITKRFFYKAGKCVFCGKEREGLEDVHEHTLEERIEE